MTTTRPYALACGFRLRGIQADTYPQVDPAQVTVSPPSGPTISLTPSEAEVLADALLAEALHASGAAPPPSAPSDALGERDHLRDELAELRATLDRTLAQAGRRSSTPSTTTARRIAGARRAGWRPRPAPGPPLSGRISSRDGGQRRLAISDPKP